MNLAVKRPSEPFSIGFKTCNMAPGYGVKCEDLDSYGPTLMATVVENSDEPVSFPDGVKKAEMLDS